MKSEGNRQIIEELNNYKHPARDTNDLITSKDDLGDRSDFAQNNYWRKPEESLEDLGIDLEDL